jgi:hypothetical protein
MQQLELIVDDLKKRIELNVLDIIVKSLVKLRLNLYNQNDLILKNQDVITSELAIYWRTNFEIETFVPIFRIESINNELYLTIR